MKSILSFGKAALLSAALAFCTASLHAQDGASGDDGQHGGRMPVNRFSDNWEVGARIGTQAYLGEYVLTHFKFGDWWTLPAADVSFSKWATNSMGFSVGFTASPFKSLYSASEKWCAAFAADSDPLYSEGMYVSRGWMGNAYASFLFDFCNAFGGYRRDRVYSLVASVGGGVMFPFSDVRYKSVSLSLNAGLVNRFRLTDRLCLDLAVRGTFHDDNFNGISYYTSGDRRNTPVDATIGATVGVSYRFSFASGNRSGR